jgi:hyaluronoglucosaminidase
MEAPLTFLRRGIVEGFFGPLWTMSHCAAIFEFGATRGMNTYLYAPKNDPYHRARWTRPYPGSQWKALLKLIRLAETHRIDFVYGFHPGKGLCFSRREPVAVLLSKARRFYDAGIRTFAVLFDDIPSHLEHAEDRSKFNRSLAMAEGVWLNEIQTRQPSSWKDVEWWICPSYYTEDSLLARTFGAFEPEFLEILAEHLPRSVPCFWTGPSVVSASITLAHIREISARVKRPLLIWDNYPVNDLSMSHELHLGPLTGRDPRLPEAVYGYLTNPLLQEALSFIPLATCFDYAANPAGYDPERSWRGVVADRFGRKAMPYWRSIREFCERWDKATNGITPKRFSPQARARMKAAVRYIEKHRNEKWAREIRPWARRLKRMVG